jgi:transposase
MGLKYSKLSPRQSGELLKLFVAGATARTAADLAGVHRNTAALFFSKVRAAVAARQERDMAAAFDGPVEVDESYFGGRRKGRRGRGAAGKVPVFGFLKRDGKVYAQMIANCRRDTLVPIVRRKVKPESVVYSDSWAGYDTLSVEGYEHRRVNHARGWWPGRGGTSTGSRTSGARPSDTCGGSTGCRRRRSRCSCRSASGGSTAAPRGNS